MDTLDLLVTEPLSATHVQRNGKRYGLAYSSCSCGSSAGSGLGLKALLATSGFRHRKVVLGEKDS